MASCLVLGCKNGNIWQITSRDFKSVPFNICHKHLKESKEYQRAYTALVSARFSDQTDSSLEHDHYKFFKMLNTWKWSIKLACSECKSTKQLWATVLKADHAPSNSTQIQCNEHFVREKSATFSHMPEVLHGGTKCEIFTLEETWNRTG